MNKNGAPHPGQALPMTYPQYLALQQLATFNAAYDGFGEGTEQREAVAERMSVYVTALAHVWAPLTYDEISALFKRWNNYVVDNIKPGETRVRVAEMFPDVAIDYQANYNSDRSPLATMPTQGTG